MNRTDVVDAVAAETGYMKVTVKNVLKSAIRVLANSLEQENSVRLRGLGFFSIKKYPPRKLYNPVKGIYVMSAGSKKVEFRQSPKIKLSYYVSKEK